MLQEEIARLTGTLKFNVEARPLVAFEKKLTGVLGMLRELSTLANKKFTVKVALDSRSLRSQIEKATRTKISLTNVDISQEALALQGKRIQEYLNRTTIRLDNVKIDIKGLVDQKRLVRTMMGQMAIKLPVSLELTKLERELRTELKAIGNRQKIQVEANLNVTQFVIKLRRALKQAEKNIGALKLRIADPQVRLKVDRQHLIQEIRAALASSEFRIQLSARGQDLRRNERGGAGRSSGGRGEAYRGLSAMTGFARGAIPGLGAAFALSQMNDISQRVIAATNSLEAVSGNEANFTSNKGFLENLTSEMGLNFREVAPQFSSIYTAAAPSIGTGGVQDMFRGIMQFGTVHGLDREAMKGSMVALSQMFGKDKIQSEEARQQFAERMPNGMALLSQAAGNVGATATGSVAEFSKLMEDGLADPKVILPELGRLMKELSERNNAYGKSLETTRVQQGRMNKTFEDSVVLFAKGGFDSGMASFFSTMTDSMERAKPLTEALGGAFEVLMKPVNALIRLVGFLGENWESFADSLGISKAALAALATSIGVFMLPFGGFIVALGVAALALDDFFTYLRGGQSVFGDLVKETPGAQEAIDGISESFSGIIVLLDQWMEKLGPLGDALRNLTINDVFLATLETIESVLKRTLDLMTAIDRLSNGDLAGADEAASRFAAKRSLYNTVTGRNEDFNNAVTPGPSFWSRESWFGTAGMGNNSMLAPETMQSQMSGTIDRTSVSRDEALTRQAMTVDVSIPIHIAGMIQAGDLAKMVEEPLREAAGEVFRQALGTARAQQAERQ